MWPPVMRTTMDRTARGFWYGVGAYASWGIVPLFWKLLVGVPVLQVVAHRVLWSSVLLGAYILLSGQAAVLRLSLSRPRVMATYALAAALIAVNWLVFIWAVQNGFLVETSLGYFMNPLLSVLLGVFVLGESLRRGQWAAVTLAALGVLYLAWTRGQMPWLSLLLAGSFAVYGLIKKRAPLGAVHGLTVETGLLAIPALVYLLWCETIGAGTFVRDGVNTSSLLVAAGAITTAPLLMFATAAQRIPLLWVGILQYIAPTLQLALGVLVYGEPFPASRLIGFSFVWLALLVFAVDGVLAHRASAVVAPPE